MTANIDYDLMNHKFIDKLKQIAWEHTTQMSKQVCDLEPNASLKVQQSLCLTAASLMTSGFIYSILLRQPDMTIDSALAMFNEIVRKNIAETYQTQNVNVEH